VPEQEERCGEERNRDHDPDALPEGVRGIEPVDLGETDRSQQAGDREEVRVGKWNGVPRREMRGEIEGEEEGRVRQRGRRHDVLSRDVDAREPDGRQDPDDDQERELTIPGAEGQRRNLR
jgi:hypothetical protein